MSPAQRDGEGRSVSLAKDVFLCHSGKQKIPVRELHKELTNKGVSCFFDDDPQSLPLAEKFPARIFGAAKKCRIAVLVISKNFIHSKWPMQELSAFFKAKSSGKNPHMKILPLFFMISPKSLSEITEDNQAWKDLGMSAKIRVEWHGALKKVRSIKGLVFKEVEDLVGFRDKVVKAICSLLLPHIPNSMQGHARQDQVLHGFASIPSTPPSDSSSFKDCYGRCSRVYCILHYFPWPS
ncbi:disease resistance protein LAZ5 isoform X1 [Cryptomeria japonica]|uniref:disease resistance protein LAZ5 isoform X1 n=1 Tax=Cryptomeria japonica TaxID=3369 RepID=UPI0027DA7356|nr:disease resistance protein LAZ5 isoform X1 [Cryptomeria japonica]XP_059076230.1 disease resistance protein LAZ5 isoform X1 [Cryptomeria japonica]XP_059076231.1 disease resistance protein LAZ5 isoform X1 [Cryptomeria japonica]